MTKKYLYLLTGLTICLLLLFGLISRIFSTMILFPSWYKPNFVDCSKNIKESSPELCEPDPSKNIKVPFENIEIEGTTGRISGWLFTTKNDSKKVIIFVHGAGGDRREGFIRVPFLLEHGYNVILFDSPNHGKSNNDGEGVSYGFKESKGFQAILDFSTKRFNDIYVITNSFGIAAVSLSNWKNSIKAMVIENPPYSLERLIRENKTAQILPGWYINIVILVTGFRGDFSPLECNPGIHAKNFPDIPILVVHGTKDDTVPFEHGKAFYENLSSSKKRFFQAEDATHGGVFLKYPEEYKKNTLELFESAGK